MEWKGFIMNCNWKTLLTPKEKGEKKTDYISRIRNIFETEVKSQKFKFEGVDTYIIFHEENSNKSWEKFMIGSEKYHNGTTKYDWRRLPYIRLIPYVMNNFANCTKCGYCEINRERKNQVKIIFNCYDAKYKIVLSRNYDKNCYYIITAYIDRRLKKATLD